MAADTVMVSVRMPAGMHAALTRAAGREHRSLSSQVIWYTERCLRDDGVYDSRLPWNSPWEDSGSGGGEQRG